MNQKINIVSRQSRLARIQVEEVMNQLPETDYEPLWLDSYGDIHHEISLLDQPPADIFTREIDRALLDDRADIAIHSAKDLPYPLISGLELIALLPPADQRDALVSRGNIALENLPVGAKIGTSSAVRRREILTLRPDVEIVSVRGTIEQRIAQVDEGKLDALIVAYCALQRLGLSCRAAEILNFETNPLQGHLAVTAKSGRNDLKVLFSDLDDRKKYGRITLVGFGPGDPDLLTIAGLKMMKEAGVICYDDLTNEAFLKIFDAELIYVGKRKGCHSMEQEQINRLLLNLAKSGKNVVRLKGGDPMIFAHGGEELCFLHENYIRTRVIPGISAGIAAASLTATPLTHRGVSSSVSFVSGHNPEFRLPDTDTVVVYMGAENIRHIAQRAVSQGRDAETPVLLVHQVSGMEQREYYFTLRELAEEKITFPTPLIVLIGETVGLRKRELKDLKKTLVTGTSFDLGNEWGEVIRQPLIEIREIKAKDTLHGAIDQLHGYDWVLFTSRYSVRFFFQELYEKGYDARYLANIKIAAVGKVTAGVLSEFGIRADLIPDDESSEGLLCCFEMQQLAPGKILIPRSAIGLPVLPDGLVKLGWKVTVVPVYENQMPEGLHPLDLTDIHQIVFSSPSCVTNFRKLYGGFPLDKEYIFKGKETEKRFNELCNYG